jgi:hypothetical protein
VCSDCDVAECEHALRHNDQGRRSAP